MSLDRVNDFVASVRSNIKGEVRADPMSRALYSTDASNYQIMPLAVALPKDRADVITLMTQAAHFGLPVLPRGGGTSLAGSTVGEAVIIDASKYMHGLVSLDVEQRRARVLPGTNLQWLNGQLAKHGLKFGPDPASAVVCTLGGMVGNNSTGSHSILYHMTADNLQAVDVVLSDGTPTRFEPTLRRDIGQHIVKGGLLGMIWQSVPYIVEQTRTALDARRPNTWRRCGGYNLDRLLAPSPNDTTGMINLAELICGSEGTLGMLTEIELKLVALPKHTGIVLVAFDDQNASLEAVPHMLEANPSAVEQIDRFLMDMQRAAGGDYSIGNFIGADDPDSLLITEFYGDSADEVQHKMAHLGRILDRVSGNPRRYCFTDGPAQKNVWEMRKAQAGLMMRQRSQLKPLNLIEDVAVPVDQLAAYIRDITHAADEIGLRLTVGAHASAGCLHVAPFVNLKTQADIDKSRQLSEAAAELVLHYKGALSSEHGDGLVRSWLNRHVFGEAIYAAFKQVKRAFDPHNRMNPGKIVDGPPQEQNLRFGPNYQTSATIELQTIFDWSADGGINNAIEQCSGVGYCRKTVSGTMCPSYMVTRDERDSTRGRANALRNALNGRLPRETLFREDMKSVMDLCVGCKACQTDCPSSIDMTRIKSEWQHRYNQQHGLSMRSWLFANLPRLGDWVTRVPGLARFVNTLMRVPELERLAGKMIGIAPQRHLPGFATGVSNGSEVSRVSDVSASSVVLYVDTWARHHYPHIAQAAHKVLIAAGYNVIVPDYVCCGRTFLSEGLLNDAREQADQVLGVLGGYASAGTPIIGLEPSCILSFRDEYPALTQHPARMALAKVACTFEEFVASNAERFAPVIEPQDQRQALLHGHCHQKAQSGTQAAHQTLALAGYCITEPDSGCCGMAGSFGYEADHYEVSKAMAERVLIPAVQATAADTMIVAAGVSCRQQIKDLAGRTALHPAEVLAARLRTPLIK